MIIIILVIFSMNENPGHLVSWGRSCQDAG